MAITSKIAGTRQLRFGFGLGTIVFWACLLESRTDSFKARSYDFQRMATMLAERKIWLQYGLESSF
jgi:hypothetical protein